jgi:hypothetical protein
MNDELSPAKVRLTDGLGATLPKRDKVEALMKRCQIGVGGRHALDNAHDIMAECYGTLGALMLAVEKLHAETVALRAMYEESDAESDALRGA